MTENEEAGRFWGGPASGTLSSGELRHPEDTAPQSNFQQRRSSIYRKRPVMSAAVQRAIAMSWGWR